MGRRFEDILSGTKIFAKSHKEITDYVIYLCQTNLPIYQKLVKYPHPKHCIRNIEGFIFCSLSVPYQLDNIFESGTMFGGSTYIWSTFFNDIKVTTIDLFYRKDTVVKLYELGNVNYIIGDGITVLPNLVSLTTGKNCAVFIDGPKGVSAVKLAIYLYKYENVKLIGIHDMNPENLRYKEAYHLWKLWDVPKFESWNQDFGNRFQQYFDPLGEKANQAVYVFKEQ
jgi:hypothetical protein